jgi:hypothetical protein
LLPVVKPEATHLAFSVIRMDTEGLERRAPRPYRAVERVADDVAAAGGPEFVDMMPVQGTRNDVDMRVVLGDVCSRSGRIASPKNTLTPNARNISSCSDR